MDKAEYRCTANGSGVSEGELRVQTVYLVQAVFEYLDVLAEALPLLGDVLLLE